MPKGVRGFQKKVVVSEKPEAENVEVAQEVVIKTCAVCNEWLFMGVCSRDGSRKSSKSEQCEAKLSGQ